MKKLITFLFLFFSVTAHSDLKKDLDNQLEPLMKKVIEWRHDIHQYPELSNREFRTSKKVAEHLRSIGLEVETEVAHTGVVGLLKGGLPGPIVAIRADMDALPVIGKTGLSYASQVKTTYLGNEVGVMLLVVMMHT